MTNKTKIITILSSLFIVSALAAFLLLLGGWSTVKIEYSDEEVDATITVEGESGQGSYEEPVEGLPVVEGIDAGQRVESDDTYSELITELKNDGEEFGLGYSTDLSFVNVSSPAAFKDSVFGKCINTDGAFGGQCWDLADAFWQVYAGKRATTCGTGAAKGMAENACAEKNAGSEFVIIYDWNSLQAGDWLVFTTGQYGHIGMAQGKPNGNYIVLLGQNQGGSSCDGGGSAANLINISNRDFALAFRPKAYIEEKPEPKPEPEPETPVATSYEVKKGDTIGGVARRLEWWTAKDGLFGDDGYAEKIAKKSGIKNRGLIYPGDILVKP